MANKKSILLVEDDLYIRDVFEEILKDAGFDVTTAGDGEEGLIKAKDGGFSLILLDMMMPKKDGIQVLEDLKKYPPKKANGPIILLTNLAHQPVIEQAKSLGAVSYIVKSDMNPDQLTKTVNSFLQ